MTDPNLWLQIVALVVLLAFSAFFSASETAFIRSNGVRIRGEAEEGDRQAKRLMGMLRTPERILSTILVGNNLVNIAAASLATLIAVNLWGPATGAIVATFGLTALILVFSEITPKTFAVQHSERLAKRVSILLHGADIVLRPIAWMMTKIAYGILRLLGVKTDEASPFVTQEEIEMMVKVGAEEGEVEAFEQRVIEEVFDFTETHVHRVVTPWTRVRHLPKTATLREALELVSKSGHSRIPIVDGDFEHVMGFVHAKDLLKHTDAELESSPVTAELRAVLFTSATTPADKVLARMQRERKLMAIVQNAEGHNLGIATVEDLVEELIGEIHDEFDASAPRGGAPAEREG